MQTVAKLEAKEPSVHSMHDPSLGIDPFEQNVAENSATKPVYWTLESDRKVTIITPVVEVTEVGRARPLSGPNNAARLLHAEDKHEYMLTISTSNSVEKLMNSRVMETAPGGSMIQ